MQTITFPFIPKSTARFERGQFWAIPLADGRFGAGCVVGREHHNGKPSTRSFIAGVLAWSGTSPPTPGDLIGCEVVEHGFAHIKVITESGGTILGKSAIQFHSIPSELDDFSISTWGYKVPTVLAQKYVAASS